MAAVPFPLDLSDGDVVLRRHRPEDADDVVAQCSDPATARFTGVPSPYLPEHAEQFLAERARLWDEGTTWSFAVEHAGRFAGTVDLFARGPGAAEVGFSLGPWARGRRVLTRALRLVLPWGFEALDLDVVHWRADADNWASRRAAWAVGFRVEGEVRGLLGRGAGAPGDGRRVDGWIGSLLRGEALAPRNRWFDPVPLDTGSGLLRELRETDAERVAQACGDPLTQTWLPFMPAPYTVQDALERISTALDGQAGGRRVTWALTDREHDVLLGEVGLYRVSGPQGELGYLAHPQGRGRGLVTDAARTVSEYALSAVGDGGLGLRRLLLVVADGNAASERVAKAAGFVPCGRESRAEVLRDGRVVDLLRFERLA